MIDEKMEELANEMKAALRAARKIPQDILHDSPEMLLTREDYKTMATSLFIEYHRSEKKNGDGKYEGPITEKQLNFVDILVNEKEHSDDTVMPYLESCGKASVKELTSSEATTLIDMLKTLKKKERRHNCAPR
jgi:hypothetical protein